MRKLMITGVALWSMAIAAPSFAAGRQQEMKKDSTKKDDTSTDKSY